MHRALIRYARTALALMATGAVSVWQNDNRYILLAPLVNAFGKYLREEHGFKYIVF